MFEVWFKPNNNSIWFGVYKKSNQTVNTPTQNFTSPTPTFCAKHVIEVFTRRKGEKLEKNKKDKIGFREI